MYIYSDGRTTFRVVVPVLFSTGHYFILCMCVFGGGDVDDENEV
jgi:hypothetical protein